MYKSGNLQAQPNLVSYVTLINSIVRSNQRGSAQVAEETLHEMYKEYKAGSITIPPNARIVTSVIDCWQKSGERDAGERAERLLDWLLEIYGEERHDSLQPNEYTFNSGAFLRRGDHRFGTCHVLSSCAPRIYLVYTIVISAWARTRKFGKAARAKAILSKMIQLKDAGIISASPNAHCYTAVINSCAYCENDSLDKSLSLRIAIETYKELLNSNHEGPNQITFSTFLTALQNLMPPNEKRAVAIRTIFKRCADDGLVSDLVLRRLQSSLSQDQLRKVLGKTVVSPEGTVNAEQIPLIWRRNVNDLRPRRSARQEA